MRHHARARLFTLTRGDAEGMAGEIARVAGLAFGVM